MEREQWRFSPRSCGKLYQKRYAIRSGHAYVHEYLLVLLRGDFLRQHLCSQDCIGTVPQRDWFKHLVSHNDRLVERIQPLRQRRN